MWSTLRTMALVSAAVLVVACGSDEEPTDTTGGTGAEEASGEPDASPEPDEGEAASETGEGPPADLIAAAQQEGEVMVYTAIGAQVVDEWGRSFEEKYGIPVLTNRPGAAAATHEAWAQETEAGQHFADVVIHSLPLLFKEAEEKGWLAEHTPSEIDSYPAELTLPDKLFPLMAALNAHAWNTDHVTEEERQMLREQGQDALRDPRFRDRIAITAADAGGSQLAEYHHVINVLEDEYGWEFMQDLAAQNPVIYDSTVPMGQALVQGEFPVVFALGTTVVANEVLQGAPVEWGYRDDPSAGLFFIAASANAPNSAASRLFLDWALSLEGQQALVNINQGFSSHSEWVDERPIAALDWYEPFSGQVYLEWAFDESVLDDAVTDMHPRWNELFGR